MQCVVKHMILDLFFAWPNSKIAVMGGEQAAKVIMQLNKKAYKKDDPEYREIMKIITKVQVHIMQPRIYGLIK